MALYTLVGLGTRLTTPSQAHLASHRTTAAGHWWCTQTCTMSTALTAPTQRCPSSEGLPLGWRCALTTVLRKCAAAPREGARGDARRRRKENASAARWLPPFGRGRGRGQPGRGASRCGSGAARGWCGTLRRCRVGPPPLLSRRLQRDLTWEADGEELHQFLEDGLVRHILTADMCGHPSAVKSSSALPDQCAAGPGWQGSSRSLLPARGACVAGFAAVGQPFNTRQQEQQMPRRLLHPLAHAPLSLMPPCCRPST